MKELKNILLLIIICAILFSCKDSDVPAEKLPTVYTKEIDGNYKLIRNGKPFYMKGGAASALFLKELKEAGGNTARIYDTTDLRKTLDKAEVLGLAVVVDIPLPKFDRDPEFFEDPQLFEPIKQKVAQVVQKHKDHPALLYWNLGNEIFYPYFYKRTKFYSNYNSLIELIHEIDPNHPVSTSTIGANKLEVLSIRLRSPELDFISFNSFGVLSKFAKKLQPIAPLWSGPHVITEWGVNGAWEAPTTLWKAPIEETSTKKAELIKYRYWNYIIPLQENNSLGTFVFYWGHKNEITPTWYSLFSKSGLKTKAVFELENIWKNKSRTYPGPELDYILLNNRGAKESIILSPDSKAEVEAFLPQDNLHGLIFEWEVRPESWYFKEESELFENINFQKSGKKVVFQTPKEEGPYRILLYLTNDTEYIATANIPFYVLKEQDEN